MALGWNGASISNEPCCKKMEDFKRTISKMTNSELHKAKGMLDREVELSELAIEGGFEERK